MPIRESASGVKLSETWYKFVMFGDEPYGNYNRILLSNILTGAQDPARFLSIRWIGIGTIHRIACRRACGRY